MSARRHSRRVQLLPDRPWSSPWRSLLPRSARRGGPIGAGGALTAITDSETAVNGRSASTADMRASPGRLAGRPCSTRTGIMWSEGEADRRSPDIMPACDPNVCRRRLRDIPQLPRGSWQEGTLKGLIAGCGGQAFEHLSAAGPPDPAPWCGRPGVADWSERHRVRVPGLPVRVAWAGPPLLARRSPVRWRRRPRPFLVVGGLPAAVCGRLRVTDSWGGWPGDQVTDAIGLGRERVRAPVGMRVINRCVGDLLDVAPVCVGGVDALLPGAWAGSGEQREDDLRAAR
jgi:hypothetical protein